jgi:hypothetical protein
MNDRLDAAILILRVYCIFRNKMSSFNTLTAYAKVSKSKEPHREASIVAAARRFIVRGVCRDHVGVDGWVSDAGDGCARH